MSSSRILPAAEAGPRRIRASLKVAAILIAGLAGANAAAAPGLLEKLLAPAIGTKPGFSEGKKTYNEDTLKPDELQSCIVKAHDIDGQPKQSPEEVAALNKEGQELGAEAKALTAAMEAAKKDPPEQDEADKLNARIAEYTKRQKAFNAKVESVNATSTQNTKAANAALNDFIDNCAGKRFFKSDLEAVRPKLPFDISDILAGKK